MKKSTTKLEPTLKTHAESARVSTGFEKLGSRETMDVYNSLDLTLSNLAKQVSGTLNQVMPHLVRMQKLLSQRGAARKKVLADANLPTWSEYATKYAEKLDCSFRTIQARITELKREDEVAPSKLILNKPKPQPKPDWRGVVSTLVHGIEQSSASLPTPVVAMIQQAKVTLNPTPEDATLPVVLSSEPCCGCSVMHESIAKRAAENPNWTDQELAEKTGCSLTIVRQAITRFGLWKAAA